MHLHLVGHMAHGGKVLSGEPAPVDANGSFVLDDTYNINTALSPAKDLALHKSISHGLLNDTPGDGTYDGTRSWYGAPYFSGWPKWTSTTHQQTYYVWLERAWRGGLRAATMLAVHNESLCKTSLKGTRVTSWPICADSMLHIVEQLKAARDFERFIDDRSGGTGQGWFRIVTTPQQAREVIRAGKLAVVLGIEVDNLFNCKEASCPADFGLPAARIAPLTQLAQPTTIEQAVDVIYDIGVRHIFPVHNFDNGFGAAATWMDSIGIGQAVSEQRWWETEDCGTGQGDYGFWIDNVLFPLMELLGFGIAETPPIPDYISGLMSCNTRGLRPAENELIPGGQRLIQALMNKGMLIDIDHMSRHSVDETILLTRSTPGSAIEPYPLLAGHVQFFDLHQQVFRDNRGRHERMRTRDQLNAIRDGGGMIAAMLKDDVQDTDLKGEKYTLAYTPLFGGAIADDCRHSTKTWAQALQYAVDVMDGPVAMGSDFNGAAGHVGPRFGSDACGGWGEPNGQERLQQEIAQNRVTYPFSLPGFGTFDNQVTGFKTFDYNVDGLAHVGLLPDMVADLQNIGLNQHYMDQVFCSAEAYIRVWERAEAIAGGQPLPDPGRPWLCNITDDTPPASAVSLTPPAPASGWHNGDVTATITATDADSGVERIDFSTTFNTQISAGSAVGDHATVTISNEGDSVLSYFATDNAGNVEQPHSATVRIDSTVPEITGDTTPAANAGGWNNSDVTVSFTCTDLLSGVESCTSPQTVSSEGANQSVTGEAVDKADNHASFTVANINIDKTPPKVEITGVADGAVYILGSVPVAGCSTSDALSGVSVAAVVAVTGGSSNGVGTFSVRCEGALDVAGNPGSANASYVVHYTFNGFAAPVDNPPVINAIKAGQTVPLKFGLGGDHGLDVLQGGAPTSVKINCTAGTVDDVEEIVTTPGASLLTYDPLTSLYQFNWKTAKSWAGTCRRLLLKLDDDTVHGADFQLK
jgi:microsomal dipeptidase-like Zn-dependent dipeptidase